MHVVGPTLVDAWINHANGEFCGALVLALSIKELIDFSVTAVVMAGLPGEQSGPSIVDVLYGNVNPSGRLPYTIAQKSSDWPTRKYYTSLTASFIPIR